MRLYQRVFMLGLVIGLSATDVARAEDNQNEVEQFIPLEEIWAYKMPGTRAIAEVAIPADIRHLGSVVESWFRRAERLKFKDVARRGFAVSGRGIAAMRAALAVFDGE
jgi:hypothetical protein